MKRVEIIKLLEAGEVGATVCVKGWVRTKRGSKNVAFIALNDGTCLNSIQVVADVDQFAEDDLRRITTGASISVSGELAASKGAGQKVEIVAEQLEILGEAPADEYPLQPKKHSMEFLRDIAHLRFRTNTFSAVFRIRHALSFSVHEFFNKNGFYHIHTPIITGSDAEGAGEMFKVTNFDLNNIPRNEEGAIDFRQDFFESETNLTVSGQLEAELAALALSKVYTFGPTFRAENSNTSRHLAEFWMIEPEVAFADLAENMDLAQDFLRYTINYVLENCKEDLNFLNRRFEEIESKKPKNERSDSGLIEKLEYVLRDDFKRITYSEAIDILRNCKPNKKKKFNYIIEGWGADLQSEHERYLVEKHFKSPVIIYDYPADIKAFYMRQNDDNQTVAAMDVLFPGIGEIIGGSQREERLDVLKKKMADFNIPEDEMQWYLDTRRFGTVPHSGFGLGFERLMLFVTGMTNIRDVIAFPRTPGNAKF